MDIGLFIVLMLVVYVVPELLKRLKKKTPYQYPDFPASPPSIPYPTAPGIPGELSRGMKPPPMPLYALQDEGTAGDEGDPEWGAKATASVSGIGIGEVEEKTAWSLGPNQALQGFVWAEIMAPPLALRQVRHNRGRF